MYQDTITLFNRYKDGLTLKWYPTVIRNVDFNYNRSTTDGRYGTDSADLATLHIRYTNNKGVPYVAKKRVCAPREYTSANSPATTLCFRSGEDFDFILLGEYSETPVDNSAYGIDGFYDHMNAQYDNVYRISSCAKYSVIPHFEVSLR